MRMNTRLFDEALGTSASAPLLPVEATKCSPVVGPPASANGAFKMLAYQCSLKSSPNSRANSEEARLQFHVLPRRSCRHDHAADIPVEGVAEIATAFTENGRGRPPR
jgi:hypothetical protein